MDGLRVLFTLFLIIFKVEEEILVMSVPNIMGDFAIAHMPK